MVEKPPTVIYTTHPPQWDKIMWCGCGYEKNMGREWGKTEGEILREKWKEANK